MSKIIEIIVFIGVILLAIALIIITGSELLKLPDSDNKTLAITLMIPIIGAIFTGIGIELFKFIMDRSERDNIRKKEKLEEITKIAISISLNMVKGKNGITYINPAEFSNDIRNLISLITSELNQKTIKTILPLINILNSKGKDNSREEKYKEILGNILVEVRKSFGYYIDDELKDIIIKSII